VNDFKILFFRLLERTSARGTTCFSRLLRRTQPAHENHAVAVESVSRLLGTASRHLEGERIGKDGRPEGDGYSKIRWTENQQ
jgi:hypothetical protein